MGGELVVSVKFNESGFTDPIYESCLHTTECHAPRTSAVNVVRLDTIMDGSTTEVPLREAMEGHDEPRHRSHIYI